MKNKEIERIRFVTSAYELSDSLRYSIDTYKDIIKILGYADHPQLKTPLKGFERAFKKVYTLSCELNQDELNPLNIDLIKVDKLSKTIDKLNERYEDVYKAVQDIAEKPSFKEEKLEWKMLYLSLDFIRGLVCDLKGITWTYGEVI